VPLAIQLGQLAYCFWLGAQGPRAAQTETTAAPSEDAQSSRLPHLNPRPIAKARMFQRMAWLANPFAYIAINTLVAVMPALAARLGLSATFAGFYGSLWCFARFGAFFLLWFWQGWYYRFGWMVAAYVALVATFTAMLISPNLTCLITAQVVFGAAI